jgi:hypothetical protein
MGILLIIRWHLVRQNKIRETEGPSDDDYDDVHMDKVDADGKQTNVRVERVRMILCAVLV